MMFAKYVRFVVLLLLLSLTCVNAVLAQASPQAPSGILRGQVTDPSGAAISGASVIMTPVTGSPIVITSNAQGMYEFKNLPAGKYTLSEYFTS